MKNVNVEDLVSEKPNACSIMVSSLNYSIDGLKALENTLATIYTNLIGSEVAIIDLPRPELPNRYHSLSVIETYVDKLNDLAKQIHELTY